MTDYRPRPTLSDLTSRELEVIEAARCGTMLVCSELPVDQLAADDDPAREVQAELLRELLLGLHGPVDPRGVRLMGARIIGMLDLDTISADTGLRLINCVFPEYIDTTNCHLPWLWLNRSHIEGLLARQLIVGGDVRLDSVRVGGGGNGSISLQGARIGGVLDLNDVQITNDGGPTLLADGLKVDGDIYLRGVRIVGSGVGSEVRLTGAEVGGQLVLSDSDISNETGSALIADRLSVKGDLLLMATRARGAGRFGVLYLHGARIGGMLDLDGAELANDTGPALRADRLQVDGNLDLRNIKVGGAGELGTVRLLGARIGGRLDLEGAEISNASGTSLQLQEAHAGEAIDLPFTVVCSAPTPDSPCSDAKVVDVDGLTFSALSRMGWQQWLHVIRLHTREYRPSTATAVR
ncbi:hypothetical protein [Amycolatopsis sp. NPDC051061]|uniref:hypothetical protein n=1 Tax=Amycolatopsis sp. NPDC051061 TaxID=3155042 RepID=UPI00344A00F8